MSERKAGGTAFPHHNDAEKVYNYNCPGMSLLDYFAGQALIGLLAHGPRDDDTSALDQAEEAYVFADCMLQVREMPES